MHISALIAEGSQATFEIDSNVAEGQLSGATPCSEFDVKALLTHMEIESTRPNITLFETVLHGWGLAKATGQELQVSDDVGEALFSITQRICTDERRIGLREGAGPERSRPKLVALDLARLYS